jgi:hypothetical protein
MIDFGKILFKIVFAILLSVIVFLIIRNLIVKINIIQYIFIEFVIVIFARFSKFVSLSINRTDNDGRE